MSTLPREAPVLTVEEREAVNGGRWFSGLSAALRHDILRCAYVRRYPDGAAIARRGEPVREWMACARGAVRMGALTAAGKQVTLAYIEPGVWFGDIAMFDGEGRTHDVYAHGDTTLLCVNFQDLRSILLHHVELYQALLKLQARRLRQMFAIVEDLNTLPLRARLAKYLLFLVRSYGVPASEQGPAQRIGLQLAQEEIAQLIGASRQRVNHELKILEREGHIRIESTGLLVQNHAALARIANEVTP